MQLLTTPWSGFHGVIMDMVLWSIVPKDWEQPPFEVIVQRVSTEIRSGAIVLLHDGGGIADRL